jgi:hypothetical protein
LFRLGEAESIARANAADRDEAARIQAANDTAAENARIAAKSFAFRASNARQIIIYLNYSIGN